MGLFLELTLVTLLVLSALLAEMSALVVSLGSKTTLPLVLVEVLLLWIVTVSAELAHLSSQIPLQGPGSSLLILFHQALHLLSSDFQETPRSPFEEAIVKLSKVVGPAKDLWSPQVY